MSEQSLPAGEPEPEEGWEWPARDGLPRPAAEGSERYGDLGGLDVAATLAAAGRARVDEHAALVRALQVDQHFAVLHAEDPQAGRGPRPGLKDLKGSGWTLEQWQAGANKLVQLGGDGTPMVQDLPLCELAVARGVHDYAARSHLADALDLDHRLAGTWAGVREGRGTVWVVRKVARLSRHLDRDQVRIVDDAVAAALDEAPGRVLTIAEAAIMRADPEAARAQADERARRRYFAIGRVDEDGLRKIYGRLDAGDAAWLEAMVNRIADALEARPDLIGHLVARATEDGPGYKREELLAEAAGWLPHLEDVIALLNGTYLVETEPPPDPDDLDPEEAEPDEAEPDETEPDETEPDETEPDEAEPEDPESVPSSTRGTAVVYVHLSDAAVAAALTDGVVDIARVEGLGPVLLDQLARLLGHAHVDLKPVIDLNHNRSVSGYEHPPDVQERSFLRMSGDVFPHAQTQSRRVDNDHPDPYQPNGPPGQTGDLNCAPLGRRSHRAKTHLPYRLIQLGLGRYLWRTPHGMYRLVDGTGTHKIDEATAWRLVSEHVSHS